MKLEDVASKPTSNGPSELSRGGYFWIGWATGIDSAIVLYLLILIVSRAF